MSGYNIPIPCLLSYPLLLLFSGTGWVGFSTNSVIYFPFLLQIRLKEQAWP